MLISQILIKWWNVTDFGRAESLQIPIDGYKLLSMNAIGQQIVEITNVFA